MIKILSIVLLILINSGCAVFSPDKGDYLQTDVTRTNSDISVQFMGVSNLSITDGDSTILLDGFFTRRSALFSYCKHGMNSDESAVGHYIEKTQIPHIDALLTSHAHFDHILDSSTVLKIFNTQDRLKHRVPTTVYGSEESISFIRNQWDENAIKSDTNLVTPLFEKLKNGNRYTVGNFQIQALETPHVRKNGAKMFVENLFTCFRGGSFKKVTPNFSFLISTKSQNNFNNDTNQSLRQPKILVIPSANIRKGDLEGVDADVVFLGIGLLKPEDVQGYWDNTIKVVNAKLVIPIHWDNFYKPLTKRLTSGPNLLLHTDRVVAKLYELAEGKVGTDIAFMPVLEYVTLPRYEDQFGITKSTHQ